MSSLFVHLLLVIWLVCSTYTPPDSLLLIITSVNASSLEFKCVQPFLNDFSEVIRETLRSKTKPSFLEKNDMGQINQ